MPRSEQAIVVATSLVPGRTDALQRKAIDSWRAAGFTALSINVQTEIDALRPAFPDVDFVVAARSGQKVAGKPVPFLTDALKAAANVGPADIVGVINADIILRSGTKLRETITAHAANGVVMLPRVDVPTLDMVATAANDPNPTLSVGYDGAFVGTPLVGAMRDNAFCLGMPFWDYWLPMVAILRSWPLMSIASPEALHVTHLTAWDNTIYFYFHALVSDLLAECRDHTRQTEPPFALMTDVLANVYGKVFARGTEALGSDALSEAQRRTLADTFDAVQEVVVHHIKRRCRPLFVPAP